MPFPSKVCIDWTKRYLSKLCSSSSVSVRVLSFACKKLQRKHQLLICNNLNICISFKPCSLYTAFSSHNITVHIRLCVSVDCCIFDTFLLQRTIFLEVVMAKTWVRCSKETICVTWCVLLVVTEFSIWWCNSPNLWQVLPVWVMILMITVHVRNWIHLAAILFQMLTTGTIWRPLIFQEVNWKCTI